MNRPGLRRALHAATALTVPLALWVGWDTMRLALTLVGVPGAVAFEVLRLRTAFGPWLAQRLRVFRSSEARRPSGAFWLLVGFAATSWCPHPAVAVGILAAALADPVASAAGTRWGGAVGRKTAAGSLACWTAIAAIALGYGAGWVPALVVGAVGSALERWPGRLDDNLVLGPGVAVAFWVWV